MKNLIESRGKSKEMSMGAAICGSEYFDDRNVVIICSSDKLGQLDEYRCPTITNFYRCRL
jgi:hypothetical protein